MTTSPGKLLAIVVSVIVAAVVIGGILKVGSPAQRRIERIDAQRVSDLSAIAGYIAEEYSRTGAVPTTLDDVNDPVSSYYVPSLNDPVTDAPYEYEVIDSAEFRLCATFDESTLDTEPSRMDVRPYAPHPKLSIDFSRHPSGHHCFNGDARLLVPFSACGLRNPCPAGAACVQLAGESSAVCVPTGFECEAAGCTAEACAISEDFPAAVRCTDAVTPKVPGEPAPVPANCSLMQTPDGAVDCYGCANGICKDPVAGAAPYERPVDAMGIPYSCFVSENGCELAQ